VSVSRSALDSKKPRPVHLSFPDEAHNAFGVRRGLACSMETQDADSEAIRALHHHAVPSPDRLMAPDALPRRRVNPEIERESLTGRLPGRGRSYHEIIAWAERSVVSMDIHCVRAGAPAEHITPGSASIVERGIRQMVRKARRVGFYDNALMTLTRWNGR
jgi:hypothetical protein